MKEIQLHHNGKIKVVEAKSSRKHSISMYFNCTDIGRKINYHYTICEDKNVEKAKKTLVKKVLKEAIKKLAKVQYEHDKLDNLYFALCTQNI